MQNYVPRAIQLDALVFDAELLSLVRNQVTRIVSEFKWDALLLKYEAELDALLRLMLWKFSVHSRGASIGQSLLGVKYAGGRNRLKLLCLLEIFLPYAVQRGLQFLRLRSSSSYYYSANVEKFLKFVSYFYKLCDIGNLLFFLTEGRYPTLIHRLLRLKMLPATETLHASVGYSYQLREMLWHQFAEFFVIVVPLMQLQLNKLGQLMKRWSHVGIEQKPRSADPDAVIKCCLCGEDCFVPQKIDNCSFCYYCWKANVLADPDFRCDICNHS